MKQLLTLIILIILFIDLNAQTNIGGTLTADRKLDLAGSPYTITSNLGVPPGIKLTIDTGVTINFNGTAQLIVQGSLIANGTSKNPISFKNGGIWFHKANLSLSSLTNIKMTSSAIDLHNSLSDTNSGNLTIEYLDMSNAGILARSDKNSNANLTINNSRFNNSDILEDINSETIKINQSTFIGGYITINKEISISNSTFSNTYFTYYGLTETKINISGSSFYNSTFESAFGGMEGKTKISIKGSSLHNTGIITYYWPVDIYNCVVLYDSAYSEPYCIASPNATINYTKFIGNRNLIALERSFDGDTNSYKVENCSFKGFASNIKINKQTQFNIFNNGITINNCNFLDLPKNYFIANYSPYDINAANNYWGTTSDSIIGKYVYDYWDYTLNGKVIYTNKLTDTIKYKSEIEINSITVLPVYITPNDQIKIKAKLTMNSYGKKVSQNYYVRNDTIFIESCYYSLVGFGPVQFDDSIEIGKLNPKNYKISFRAILSSKSNDCKEINSNAKMSAFTVNPPPTVQINSINPLNNLVNANVKIYTKISINGYVKKISKKYYLSHDTIFLVNCYFYGRGSIHIIYDDTFDIGKLNSGNYIIQLTSNLSSDSNTCIRVDSKTKTSLFVVNFASIKINSVSNDPSSPIQFNYCKITINVTIGAQGKLLSQEQAIKQDTIFLKSCFFTDTLLQTKNYNDEYFVLLNNPGKHFINYIAQISIKPDSCEPVDAKSFISSLIVGWSGHTSTSTRQEIKVYPNPFITAISLQGQAVQEFIIYNSIGQTIKYGEINGSSEKSINLEFLPVGLYTLELILKDGKIYREKILKN